MKPKASKYTFYLTSSWYQKTITEEVSFFDLHCSIQFYRKADYYVAHERKVLATFKKLPMIPLRAERVVLQICDTKKI